MLCETADPSQGSGVNAEPTHLHDDADRDARLLAAAGVPFEPVRINLGYQLGLAVVAGAMLLLPVLYVALIVSLAWGVWYYAVHSPAVLFRGGGGVWRVVFYVAPIVAGVTGVLFMVKPIFARAPPPPPPIILPPADQPLLHRFVERLCQALGAPIPREIRVDMEVNASASFRRGARSMLGNDLVLTLGLPLVAGLNVTQLSGILAHEFGHFGQAVAMRFTYLIGAVNHWFARVVYERDVWDVRLEQASREATTGAAQAVILLATVFVWLSRRLLWLLMYAGHVLSAYLSRQMEYNADQHQVQVSGSEGFRPIYLRMGVLHVAAQAAGRQVNDLMSEGRLPDNLPALILIHAQRFEESADARSQLSRELLEERTRWFETHPSAKDRVRHAERLRMEPKMRCPHLARELFRDFDALAVRCTSSWYEAQLGERWASFTMVSTEDASAGLVAAEQAAEAGARVLYGGAVLSFGIAPRTVHPVPPSNVAEGVAAIRAAREQAERAKAWVSSRSGRYDRAYEREQKLGAALTLGAAGIHFSAEQLDVPTRDALELIRLKQAAGEEREQARRALAAVFSAIHDRIDAAASLASHPEISGSLTNDAQIRDNYPAIAQTLQMMERNWVHLAELNTNVQHLSMLAANAAQYGEEEAFQREAERVVRETHDIMRLLARRLSETPYPFEHAQGAVAVADYAVPSRPEATMRIIQDAGAALDRLRSLYGRCWAELARLVERVEASVGFPSLDLEVRGD